MLKRVGTLRWGESSVRRLTISSVLALAFTASTLSLGGPARAGTEWCEDDPVFMVNGGLVDVTTSFPWYAVPLITNVSFELLVPSNVTAAVVSIPSNVPTTSRVMPSLPRYDGIGAIPIVVNVRVAATGSFPTSTQITGGYTSAPATSTTIAGTTSTSSSSGGTTGGVSTVSGQSNVTTQVGYSLIGL